MLSDKMAGALNAQLNAELYSAYLYMSMSAHFQAENLTGFANWMRVQAQEEMMHAVKFYDFINERGGRVLLKAVDGPPTEWESPLAAFADVLEHEQKVTGLINNLVNLAMDERDYATNAFLQWFVTEQVEEESSANDVVQKLKLVGGHPGGLFMVDQEMAKRVFTPPAQPSQA
ncbi:MAG: ferritin [Candidatus Abyssubacteria bacterium]